MRKFLIGIAASAAMFAAVPAHAVINSFVAFLSGTKEVPGPGDPDGFGIATVLIDSSANTVSWSFLANNILTPLTGSHIHSGSSTVAGPVIVDFGGSFSGNGLVDADLASITPANASLFYVNLHNAAHPSGAIRGQLSFVGAIPEPTTYGLMLAGLGAVGLLARRRRRLDA